MQEYYPTNTAGYFQRYITQVPETAIELAFSNQTAVIESYLYSISEGKSLHAYAPQKWTIKEMLQHIIDTERIFCYRAVCFARGETIALPGYDENIYAANSAANNRSWKSLVIEFLIVRQGTLILFKSFTPYMLKKAGTSSGNILSVLDIGFILVGHFYHHKKILEERYF